MRRRHRDPAAKVQKLRHADLPLNFHPAAIKSRGFYAVWRGWSNVRSAELVGVAQPIARCGEIGGIGRRREVAAATSAGAGRCSRRPSPRSWCGRDRGRRTGVSLRSSSRIRPLKLSTEAVLHRLARRDEVPVDAVCSFAPGEHGVRGELGAVVGDDHARLAAPFDRAPSVRAPRAVPRSRCRGSPPGIPG